MPFRQGAPDGAVALNYAVRKPKGVVAVISPWNLLLLLMTWKVAPAPACGNAVALKPSEETPSTTTSLGAVMRDSGPPPGVYDVVNGFGPDSAGEFLVRHPHIGAITFTSETRTGGAIMKVASTGMRDISSELGGKGPELAFFSGCDLDKAVTGTVRSSFTTVARFVYAPNVSTRALLFSMLYSALERRTEKLKFSYLDRKNGEIGPLITKTGGGPSS